jgi:hypothetical protein
VAVVDGRADAAAFIAISEFQTFRAKTYQTGMFSNHSTQGSVKRFGPLRHVLTARR